MFKKFYLSIFYFFVKLYSKTLDIQGLSKLSLDDLQTITSIDI